MLLQGYFKGGFQECFKGSGKEVSKLIQESCKAVSGKLQRCVKKSSECSREILKLHGFFLSVYMKSFSKVFQRRFVLLLLCGIRRSLLSRRRAYFFLKGPLT